MLQTKGLTYSYDDRLVLEFPDMRCAGGEHWLILGQSGCGKTTLLHLLGGLLTPRSGSVRLGDTDLARLNLSERDKFRGKHIGIIFQTPHFLRALTVEENLAVAQKLSGLPIDMGRIRQLLTRLNIAHKLKTRPDELSQGERQRAAISRALVNRPSIILADEPTSALDDNNTAEVARLLEETADEVNAALLIVTHDGRLKSRFRRQISLQPQPAAEALC